MTAMEQKKERALWIADHRSYARKQLLMYQGLLKNEHETIHNVKRAKAIAYILDHYPVEIGEEDILVGTHTAGELTDAEKLELRKSQVYLREYQGPLLYGSGNGGTGGHRVEDFEKLLRLGVKGILDEVTELEQSISYSRDDDVERSHFYSACRISLDALLIFAGRYRRTLEKLYQNEKNTQRKQEYKRLVEIFSWIPYRPARDFYEALQCVWFVQFTLGFDDISCTGRPDNYLYPYYKSGIEAGTLTSEFALRLIEELYLRSNEVFGEWPETIMVGGVDRTGKPVLNDLTYLFIEAVERVGLVNPNVALCYREDTPDDLLLLCVDKISKGLSHPAIYNDRVITDGLIDAGLKIEDARYYINSTCVEITPIGCSNVQVSNPVLYPVKALELLLNGGKQILEDDMYLPHEVGRDVVESWTQPLGERGLRVDLGVLDSFEKFYDTYKQLLAVVIQASVIPTIRMAYRLSRYGSSPLVSCFVNDCIERGRDAAAGGARYNYWGSMVMGFSTAVDSLNAVRNAVYQEEMITLQDLNAMLHRNFDGSEDFRQYLLNRCPKYGNNSDNADAIATDLYDFMRCELRKYKTCLGGTYYLGIFSGWGGKPRGAHVNRGMVTAATPDGRLQGTPLSRNIGPALGADKMGLTAMVNSVTRMDHKFGIGGISLNCRLSRSLFAEATDREKIATFIREFMRKGGFEIQMNVVDTKTLREARQNPERYRTLMVRVAGYSDYFCNLDERLQDEIIARTEYART